MPSTIRRIPLESATLHHSHDFHQIVITLCGTSDFEIEGWAAASTHFQAVLCPPIMSTITRAAAITVS